MPESTAARLDEAVDVSSAAPLLTSEDLEVNLESAVKGDEVVAADGSRIGVLTRLPNYEHRIFQVPTGLITPRHDQPRQDFDEAKTDESQKVAAKVVPYYSYADQSLKFLIVDGERRYRKALATGDATFQVEIIWDASMENLYDLSVIMNMDRKGHNPMEEAIAFDRMIQNMIRKGEATNAGDAMELLSAKINIGVATIRNRIAYLNLPNSIQHLIRSGAISITQANKLITNEYSGNLDRLSIMLGQAAEKRQNLEKPIPDSTFSRLLKLSKATGGEDAVAKAREMTIDELVAILSTQVNTAGRTSVRVERVLDEEPSSSQKEALRTILARLAGIERRVKTLLEPPVEKTQHINSLSDLREAVGTAVRKFNFEGAKDDVLADCTALKDELTSLREQLTTELLKEKIDTVLAFISRAEGAINSGRTVKDLRSQILRAQL